MERRKKREKKKTEVRRIDSNEGRKEGRGRGKRNRKERIMIEEEKK